MAVTGRGDDERQKSLHQGTEPGHRDEDAVLDLREQLPHRRSASGSCVKAYLAGQAEVLGQLSAFGWPSVTPVTAG
jgi:hypothetical protein